MRNTATLAVVVILILSSGAPAQTNPAGVNRTPQADISNPAAAGTVMPSTYRRPVHQSQDIYAGGGAGNLLITGDVAGGRQFRGVVPYSSIGGFSARTGTESADAFLKATQTTGYGGTPGTTQPYYAPSRAVSRLPSTGSVASGTAVQADVTPDALLPVQAGSAGLDVRDLAGQYRPLSKTPQEMFDVVSRQIPTSQTETMLLKAINDIRQKELVEELEDIKAKAAELVADAEKAKGIAIMEPDQPRTGIKPLESPDQVATGSPTDKPLDIYDRMLQQLDKDFDEYMKTRDADAKAAVADPDKARLDEKLRTSRSGKRLDPNELNAQGYKLYMDLSAEYMTQGKFYRAAETYALARVYKSDDAAAFAGQAWALLATGEYMSSAWYLGRAIEMDPIAAAKKVDLPVLIGKELTEQRQADLVMWQQKTYSSELQFLLAYVNHQMGNTRDAEDDIRAASLKMEGYKPAALLREIILGSRQ